MVWYSGVSSADINALVINEVVMLFLLFKALNSITFVLFYLVEILAPQPDRASDKQASICRLVFLLQLFKTKRIYNVSR